MGGERRANLVQAGGNDAEAQVNQMRHHIRMGLIRQGGAA